MATIKEQSFNARIGTWAWDVRPNRIIADPLTSNYFGMEAEEGASGLPLKRYLAAIHAQDRDRVAAAIHKSVATGDAYSQTYRVNTLHCKERLIRVEGRCFHDPLGRPTLYPGHIVDIGDYVGDCGSIDDLRDLLDRAILSAQQMKIPLVMHFLAMATLEVSEIRREIKSVRSHLN